MADIKILSRAALIAALVFDADVEVAPTDAKPAASTVEPRGA